jgi:hypothetical protein
MLILPREMNVINVKIKNQSRQYISIKIIKITAQIKLNLSRATGTVMDVIFSISPIEILVKIAKSINDLIIHCIYIYLCLFL